MALKATIYKVNLGIADMDRGVYAEQQVTIARHPSETDERMMLRLLALGLHRPANDEQGSLEFAKGLWDTDEPDLWQRDLTGRILHWVEVGQPDEKRLLKACGRAERVTVLCFSASAALWWSGIAGKVSRAGNLEVWRIASEQSQALAGLAQRGMQLRFSVQDGTAWVSETLGAVEVTPVRLHPA
ncbi:MAG: YaeQ family protein [Burkholderiales bacterium]|jgi:uncharacterized protein YaeQ|nr:YaeQ family protein [Burkholderiales bacterium]